MKILFLPDIAGRPGRETVKNILPGVKKEYEPDLVIANGENLVHGKGVSPKAIEEMQSVGIDFFTSGNHIWHRKVGVLHLNDKDFPVLRPANYPPENVPGRGYQIVEDGMMNKILVINLIGRVFMKKDYDCPFRAFDRILQETAHEKPSAIFVDFHTEATSEKYAMGFYLDGRASAVIGTHTHVATADARILPEGTAYMTDAGMIGSYDSIIGVKKEAIINSFLTQLPAKHEPEIIGEMVFNGVIIEINEKNKKAQTINHIQRFLKI